MIVLIQITTFLNDEILDETFIRDKIGFYWRLENYQNLYIHTFNNIETLYHFKPKQQIPLDHFSGNTNPLIWSWINTLRKDSGRSS